MRTVQRSALCRSRREYFSVSLHVPFLNHLFELDSYSNEYSLAKFGFDTAEYEPFKFHNFSSLQGLNFHRGVSSPSSSKPGGVAPLCQEAGACATLPDLVHVHEFAAALLGVPPSDAAVAQVDDGTNSKFEKKTNC